MMLTSHAQTGAERKDRGGQRPASVPHADRGTHLPAREVWWGPRKLPWPAAGCRVRARLSALTSLLHGPGPPAWGPAAYTSYQENAASHGPGQSEAEIFFSSDSGLCPLACRVHQGTGRAVGVRSSSALALIPPSACRHASGLSHEPGSKFPHDRVTEHKGILGLRISLDGPL